MKRYLVFGAAGLVFFCCCRQIKKFRLPGWRPQSGASVPFTVVGPEFTVSSPALLRLKTGDLAAVFKGSGRTSGGRDKTVFMSRSKDDGRTWSKPKSVLTGLRDFQNPSLIQLPDGRMVLIYGWGIGAAPQSGLTESGFFNSFSHDDGATFTAPRRVRVPKADWVETGAGMLSLDDGTLLAPLTAGRKNGGSAVLLAVSKDRGEKWDTFLTVSRDSLGGPSRRKPALARLPDRKLVCMMEGGEDDPYLYETQSADDGLTWDKIRTTGIQGKKPGLIVTVRGTLMCAFRDLWPEGISLVRSYDLGLSWEGEIQLLDSPRSNPIPCLALIPNDALTAVFECKDPDGKSVIQGIRFQDEPPSAPTGLSGSFKPDRSIHLRWNSVKGAAYYLVDRNAASASASKADTGFTAVHHGTSVQPRFIDRDADTLKTYRYRVSAVRTFGRPVDGTGSRSDPSAMISVKYRK